MTLAGSGQRLAEKKGRIRFVPGFPKLLHVTSFLLSLLRLVLFSVGKRRSRQLCPLYRLMAAYLETIAVEILSCEMRATQKAS